MSARRRARLRRREHLPDEDGGAEQAVHLGLLLAPLRGLLALPLTAGVRAGLDTPAR